MATLEKRRPISLFHAFPSFRLGGSQARFIRLAHALGGDFHHFIMAMDSCYDAANNLEGLTNISMVNVPTSRGRNLNNVPRFAQALKRLDCDRVVSYNFGAIDWAFASACARVPHLHVEDGFGSDESEKRLMRRSLLRSIALNLSRADVVTVSGGLSKIARREWRIRPKKIHFVPNGIDADSIRPAIRRQHPSRFAPNGEIVIGTVAGLRPEKRIDRLLESIALMSAQQNVMLVIAGNGSMRQELDALARSLQIHDRVNFLGHVDKVQDIYCEFDIFALPSDTEQMPLVVLEAMAAGLPIASTDVGDVRHMVADSNLNWIVPRSTEALAKALSEMATVNTKRINVGMDNFTRVRSMFTSGSMYDAWRTLFSGGHLEARGHETYC